METNPQRLNGVFTIGEVLQHSGFYNKNLMVVKKDRKPLLEKKIQRKRKPRSKRL